METTDYRTDIYIDEITEGVAQDLGLAVEDIESVEPVHAYIDIYGELVVVCDVTVRDES